MRKQFDELVETMQRWDLYFKGDEVDCALIDLGSAIDEVEKRIECAVRSAKEANEAISKYTARVDANESFVMNVNHHDSILRGSNDVTIALDLGEDMCIKDNWYNLFSPKEEPKEEPIEVFMSFESSWGIITCAEDGVVISVYGDLEFKGERNYLFDIAKFDLVEYGKFCESRNITMGEADDILAVGFWRKDNIYNAPDYEWRKNIFGEADDKIDAPTVLCSDPTKHEIVNSIISQLKEIEVDGETMEYILRQVGMEEQMLKQLFAQSTNDEIDYLHDVRNGKG